jgi:protein NrfD
MAATVSAGRTGGPDGGRGPLASWRIPIWVLFAVALGAGVVGMWMRVFTGHHEAGYGSYVPWGLWIAIYFHGMGIAAGAFGVTAIAYLLRRDGFRSARSLRIGVVLAVAAVAPALLAVGLDLGRMERAWRILLTPSFSSLMAFNTWTYIVFLAVCAVVWFLSYRPDRGWLKPVLILGAFLSVAIPSQSGAFFAVVDAKAFWHTGQLPILMLISGFTSGAAALLVVRGVMAGSGTQQAWREEAGALSLLRRIVLVGIGVYFFMEFAEVTTTLWSGNADPSWSLMLTGPYWWVFWIVHLLVGGIVAAALLITRNPTAWVASGAVVVVAFLSSRLNVLIPGQAVEDLTGMQAAYVHPRLDDAYVATPMEYMVALFALALGVAVLYVGLRVSAAVEARYAKGEGSLDD